LGNRKVDMAAKRAPFVIWLLRTLLTAPLSTEADRKLCERALLLLDDEPWKLAEKPGEGISLIEALRHNAALMVAPEVTEEMRATLAGAARMMLDAARLLTAVQPVAAALREEAKIIWENNKIDCPAVRPDPCEPDRAWAENTEDEQLRHQDYIHWAELIERAAQA
jgi:hypothetical protein